MKNAPQMKRQIVKSKEEFREWVNSYNGIMNCYTTVYDFDDFTDNAKVDSSVILDRMFLDFDAHGEPLENAYDDFVGVHQYFVEHNIKHDTIFSGKGFHIIAYGEVADDIRCIQEYYTELAKDYPTLDRTGIQTNRLRRIPNTMNLSTDEGLYCQGVVPIEWKISLFWRDGRKVTFVETLIQWPKVKPVSMSETLIEVPEAIGRIPILPCLQNAITVENPSHMARVYLVQWYRDILSLGNRNVDQEKQAEIVATIMNELEYIASRDEIWLDWDA